MHKPIIYMLLPALLLTAACTDLSDIHPNDEALASVHSGVYILCEGNFNSGNATLSYYNPDSKSVENGVFKRANDRRLGDTGQSINIYNGTAYIAVENSGIVWGISTANFKVKGQLTAQAGTKITNPRYVLPLSDRKAYVTDLYSPYINIFNPTTFQYSGAIDVSQIRNNGYCSTEQLVQCGNEVFVSCWSYSNKILIIDTNTDALCDSIILSSWQPKSIKVDCNGKLWVITDGGYYTDESVFGDNIPHLYRIDARTRKIELDQPLPTDDANVQLALNATGNVLYVLDNDIYRMSVTADSLRTTPFLRAPLDKDGKRHKLYGIGIDPASNDIYVADAVDYHQSGVIFRYSQDGTELDNFRVGILPSQFAFSSEESIIPAQDKEEQEKLLEHSLVNKVYEYMPAPGHQVNGYTIVGDFIHDGATMQEACDTAMIHFRRNWSVSLGGQGGYIIAGWDHKVYNSQTDYDIVIKGNPYSYQSEPGIIWVSRDDNGNGLPDDIWYELKGSEYGTSNHTTGYEITYYKPTAPAQDIEWTDNMGGSGIIPYMPAWNGHDSYWQDWVPTQTDSLGREYRTYYGSRLKDTHTYVDGYTNEPPFNWGYADNDGSDYFNNSNFRLVSGKLGYYRISNAVKADGTDAGLSEIDFIKIQTGQTGWSPNLGEISTEVYGIWDYHYTAGNE